MGSDVKKKSFEKERKKYLAYPQKKKLKLKKKISWDTNNTLVEYNGLTNKNPELPVSLSQKPKLPDFYEPSNEPKLPR